MTSPGDEDDGSGAFRELDDEYYLAPATESAARAAAALPMTPSEDAAHVLGDLDLPEKGEGGGGGDEAEREYLPSEAANWVVTATFPQSPRLDPSRVAALFGGPWAKRFGGSMLYGRDADTGLWTFLLSADGPKAVTELKFDWDYVERDGDHDAPVDSSTMYQRRLDALREQLLTLDAGEPALTATLPPDQAARRATALYQIKQRLDRHAVLVLKAPPGKTYSGRILWDVMLCLGLTWGDMDCFHWADKSETVDYLFSVETTTPPGYFFPEHLASGEMKPQDLVFVFSIPRTPAPCQVFDAMLRAVEYCRRRLGGGTIHDANGAPADRDAIRAELAAVERDLAAVGLTPASQDALQIF